jgi:hypothetical protein
MIFSCYAKDRSPLQAAEFFASTYFEEPRQVFSILPVGAGWIFSLMDGTARYRLDYHPGSFPLDPAAYVVCRMTEKLPDAPCE